MALYAVHAHRAPRRNGHNIVTADLMRRQMCKRPDRHVFDVPMQYVRVEINHHGQPTAVFRCPACGRTRGIAQDFKTGRPFQLWQSNGSR